MRGLVDFGRVEEMLGRIRGRVDHARAARVTPLAAPMLLERGRVPVAGAARERLMAEAARRGHTIYAFQQKDMALEGGKVSAKVARITLTGEPDDWYRADAPEAVGLGKFDYCAGVDHATGDAALHDDVTLFPILVIRMLYPLAFRDQS